MSPSCTLKLKVHRGRYRICERGGGGGGGGGGGKKNYIRRCRRQCIEVCSTDQSAQSAEIFFAFIFQLSGWALMAPSCFALQVPDVRGLQVPGPPCASFLLKFLSKFRSQTYVQSYT